MTTDRRSRAIRKAAAAALFLLIPLLTLPARPAAAADGLSTPDQLLAYIASHRADVGLVSYTVDAEGRIDPADPVILHNPDLSMPLASTFKIVVLAAYARGVELGHLDPAMRLSVGDWERNFLPGTDGGAHAAALDELGIPADEFGFALDATRTVTLDQAVHAMIKFSDNTATDFVMETIGAPEIRATLDVANLRKQQMPVPLVGTFLAWSNHEDGSLTASRMRDLLQLTPAQYQARVRELTALFHNQTWRVLEYYFRLTAEKPATPQVEARVADRLFFTGSPREYGRIMAKVLTGTFLSPGISATMRRHLGWITEIPQIGDLFSAAGFKGGSLYGVLNSVWYLVPKAGDFGGRNRVVVLFLRSLPIPAWNQIDAAATWLQFDLLLGADRTFAEKVVNALQ
jgi:hypothetical protein